MSNLEMSNSQNVLTALAVSVCDVTIILGVTGKLHECSLALS